MATYAVSVNIPHHSSISSSGLTRLLHSRHASSSASRAHSPAAGRAGAGAYPATTGPEVICRWTTEVVNVKPIVHWIVQHGVPNIEPGRRETRAICILLDGGLALHTLSPLLVHIIVPVLLTIRVLNSFLPLQLRAPDD